MINPVDRPNSKLARRDVDLVDRTDKRLQMLEDAHAKEAANAVDWNGRWVKP
jgi:hypothetical protein